MTTYEFILIIYSSGIEEEITERDSLAQELSLYRDEAERMLVEKKSAATSKAETEAKQEEFLRDQVIINQSEILIMFTECNFFRMHTYIHLYIFARQQTCKQSVH